MIVADTNVISFLLIQGPFTELAEQAAKKDRWCVPPLWRSEFRNVLSLYFRQKHKTLEELRTLMAVAEKRLWDREFTVRSQTVLDCIAQSNRSAYDCEFVALAIDLDIPLVTTDDPIIQEFPKHALHLRDFVRV